MKPGLIIGRRGQSIRDLSKTLEENFGIANPQIAVAEIEVPELNARIMASRIVNALQRGVHFRRAGFWALTQIMEAGALGAEIVIRGKLTSERARYEKFRAGYLPKCGDPALKYLRSAVAHVKLKPGLEGVQVRIMPPTAQFPDKVVLKPEIEAAPISETTTEVVPTPKASTPAGESSTPAETAGAEATTVEEETTSAAS
jgi:small subunit ribosomal protein S3